MGNMFIKILSIIKFEILRIEKRLSNEELKKRLRPIIHVLEKRISEEKTDFLRKYHAHKLYFEAKKRDILSSDEINWCEHVLFGKTRIIKRRTNKKGKNFSDIVIDRRSVRDWQNSKIPNELFEELVECAKWAPSSCNNQPWHFIITNNPKKIGLLNQIKKQKFIEKAPYCILVLVNRNNYGREESFNYFSGLDSGAAIQNLLLKAEEIGLGACWVNWNPTSIDKSNEKKVKEAFKIPEKLKIISIIPIGKPKKQPNPPGRKGTNEILHFEVFKSK